MGRLGRDVLRQAMSDHFALLAKEEVPLAQVEDAQRTLHTTPEPLQTRSLVTIFGPIAVTRIAHRHKGTTNLYPADLRARRLFFCQNLSETEGGM